MFELFRVYDNEEKCWVKDNIYLSSNDELFKIKQSLFGMVKIPLALDLERYIYHRDIGLQDKDGREIFEGDYIKAQVEEYRSVIGLVTYASEMSAYIILCDDNKYYTLGSEVCELIEVVGNVFDGYEVISDGSEQAL